MDRIAITGIGTAVPPYRLEQEDASRRLREAMRERPADARWVQRIFAHSGVETRYTCEPELLEAADGCRYVPGAPPHLVPTTEERLSIYRTASVPLAVEAARKALGDSGVLPSEITHLTAASCTGMFLPGLDAELAARLDMRADVQRVPLTFLGCAAGLTALRRAEEIVRRDPLARVLVVAAELCTLHIQPSFERDQLLTASLFGDGASACVVERAEAGRAGQLVLHQAEAAAIPGSADDMQWTIGNFGFRLRLSPEIPERIGREAPEAVRAFWTDERMPERWAIHPGGRGIIDAVASAFRLTDEQTADSRAILREYGNLSSAAVLFVLNRMRERLRQSGGTEEQGLALAFGPGMTVEMVRFSYVP
ncbi:type III polyketide synthase [Cohnella hongkongensis]|uniref:Type III polyketide synthase n=1 Tax=Cohnella hongkongensis TaxID=178337 RepID=A0ABV9F7B8_9BACL